MGTLYAAFDVKLKGQDVEQSSLPIAVNKVSQVQTYIEDTTIATKHVQGLKPTMMTNGPQGTVRRESLWLY